MRILPFSIDVELITLLIKLTDLNRGKQTTVKLLHFYQPQRSRLGSVHKRFEGVAVVNSHGRSRTKDCEVTEIMKSIFSGFPIQSNVQQPRESE
mgnify:CR=1 FL=1